MPRSTPKPRDVTVYSGIALHPAQQKIWDCDARFIVAACGRRMGKTDLIKLWLAEGAGKGQKVSYMAPTNKMLSDCWREMQQLLGPVVSYNNEQERFMMLHTGGSLEFWSLDNPDGPRGRDYDRVAIDEAAKIPSADPWNYTIRATLADRQGKAMFGSTPRGMNWFYQFWMKAKQGVSGWASFQFPTSCNPHIMPEEIEDARQNLPSRVFQQEYMAEFLSSETAVFRNLDKINDATPQDDPVDGHTYFMGIDIARVEDFSVLDVIDGTTRELVVQDRSRNVSLDNQTGRILALDAKFHPVAIHIERNSFGLGIYESLAARLGSKVVGFNTTNISKMAMIDALALAFEHEELHILNDDTLLGELLAYQPTLLPGGGVRYSAPEGMHDDTVMALALCWWAAKQNMAGEVAYYRW